MKEAIERLEKIARRLEPEINLRDRLLDCVKNYGNEFLEWTEQEGAYQPPSSQSESVTNEAFTEGPQDIQEIMETLPDQLDRDGINPASGFHLGYIPGGGLYSSALGDYWADVTNRYSGIYFANPGAVRLENRLIRWMVELVNYPQSAHGNLASGGSVANLTAIVAARDAKNIDSGNVKQSVIYLSEQVHHCVIKAIKIGGLAECIIRYVELDSQYRMRSDQLDQFIQEDRLHGRNPFMVIASAGTTDTGAIDPLRSIGDIANKEGLWYHIDGAYGAFFMLTEEGQKKLDGIETSDSVVLDPHKGLFIPYGLGVILVKDAESMKQSFAQSANYMQDASENPDEISPADVSVELTRPFRGLRLWLPLKLHGIAAFRAALDEKLLLAKYFYQEIQKIPGFRVGQDPELSVVIFWYEPKESDVNAFNQQLVQEIHKDGRIFLSSTTLEDRFVLRMAILVFRTHLRMVDLALQVIAEKCRDLEQRIQNTEVIQKDMDG